MTYKIYYEVDPNEEPDWEQDEYGYVFGYPDEYCDHCLNERWDQFETKYENIAIFYMNMLENLHPKTKYTLIEAENYFE